jgi:hypothetical protein
LPTVTIDALQGKPKEIVMNSHVQRTVGELGTLQVVKFLLWVVAAALAFVLLANWPPHGSVASAADRLPAVHVNSDYVSSDPSLPSASAVFAGRFYEASQPVDTF